MAIAKRIFVGDVGTHFRLNIKDDSSGTAVAVNVSSATLITIKFTLPDLTVVSKTGVFVTDGINGSVEFVGVTGFLSLPGTWKYRAYVEYSGGKIHTSEATFKVYAV